MTPVTELALRSYVLVPLGAKTIALPAESVIELVAVGKLQQFPHQTRWISGAIVRRGRVVPVCDVSRLFQESAESARRFYLIAEWRAAGMRDWCAIPVEGECELASAENILTPSEAETAAPSPAVTGFLPPDTTTGRKVEVIDLGALLQLQSEAASTERAS